MSYFVDYTSMLHKAHHARKLNREEFEAECLSLSGGTLELLREYHEIVPCDCGELDCPGWKAKYLLKNKRQGRSA